MFNKVVLIHIVSGSLDNDGYNVSSIDIDVYYIIVLSSSFTSVHMYDLFWAVFCMNPAHVQLDMALVVEFSCYYIY